MFADTHLNFYDAKTLIEEWVFAPRDSMADAAELLAGHFSELLAVHVDDPYSIELVWKADTARRAHLWVDGLLGGRRSLGAIFSYVSVVGDQKRVEHTMTPKGIDEIVGALMQSGALPSQRVATRHAVSSASKVGASYMVPVSKQRVVGPCPCPARVSNCRHRKAVSKLFGVSLDAPNSSGDSWRTRLVQQAVSAGNILSVPYSRRNVAKSHGGIWVSDLKAWAFKSRAAFNLTRAALAH